MGFSPISSTPPTNNTLCILCPQDNNERPEHPEHQGPDGRD